MGQKVLGVLFGCVMPDDGDDNELFDKWEASGTKNRKLGLDTTVEGDRHLVGFWVGIGGNDRGLPDISEKCIPLTVIEQSRGAKKAVESWKVFVAFAKSNGINLPPPTFWLAPLEIG